MPTWAMGPPRPGTDKAPLVRYAFRITWQTLAQGHLCLRWPQPSHIEKARNSPTGASSLRLMALISVPCKSPPPGLHFPAAEGHFVCMYIHSVLWGQSINQDREIDLWCPFIQQVAKPWPRESKVSLVSSEVEREPRCPDFQATRLPLKGCSLHGQTLGAHVFYILVLIHVIFHPCHIAEN